MILILTGAFHAGGLPVGVVVGVAKLAHSEMEQLAVAEGGDADLLQFVGADVGEDGAGDAVVLKGALQMSQIDRDEPGTHVVNGPGGEVGWP